MKQLIGVINLDHELEELKELTYFRCGAAVPYAGRYRLIDFVLSNMMNAGIESIGVFVRRKYRSLMDHLGDGKPWDWIASMGACLFCHQTGTIQQIHHKGTCNISITIWTFSTEGQDNMLCMRAVAM